MDTGIGISKENAKKLFNPFVQAQSSTSSNYGGTGLGLWIAKKIIKMDGEIAIESKINQGTNFIIVFPADVESILKSPQKFKLNKSTSFLFGPEEDGKILIIDDDKFSLDILKRFLTSLKRNFLSAISVAEGIQIFNEYFYEISTVMTDSHLQDGTGIESLNEFIKIAQEMGMHMPQIISMSGDSKQQKQEMYRGYTISNFLHKTFSKNEISKGNIQKTSLV